MGGPTRTQVVPNTGLFSLTEGYAAYQKARYADTLAAHPDFHVRGAVAADAAQLAVWGPDGYVAQRLRWTLIIEAILSDPGPDSRQERWMMVWPPAPEPKQTV